MQKCHTYFFCWQLKNVYRAREVEKGRMTLFGHPPFDLCISDIFN